MGKAMEDMWICPFWEKWRYLGLPMTTNVTRQSPTSSLGQNHASNPLRENREKPKKIEGFAYNAGPSFFIQESPQKRQEIHLNLQIFPIYPTSWMDGKSLDSSYSPLRERTRKSLESLVFSLREMTRNPLNFLFSLFEKWQEYPLNSYFLSAHFNKYHSFHIISEVFLLISKVILFILK